MKFFTKKKDSPETEARELTLEERFVRAYVRKRYRARLTIELTMPSKRYKGLSRFCHDADELVDPECVVMRGRDLERRAEFLSFAKGVTGECALLSPDPELDGLSLPLAEALEKAAFGFDACIIMGRDFAVVFGETESGGRDKFLLCDLGSENESESKLAKLWKS